jgi:hypothetical protein
MNDDKQYNGMNNIKDLYRFIPLQGLDYGIYHFDVFLILLYTAN